MMYLDQPVSEGFLEVLRRRYPILKRREDFARLAGALLFPARIDDLTRRPVISARYGALLEGVTFTEAYRAARFFEEFRSKVFDFDLSGWNFEMGRARELESIHACPAILDAVRREVLIPKAGRDRLLATGEKITRRSRAKARETAMATASATLQHAATETQRVAKHMNCLPANLFTSLLSNSALAEKVVDCLPQRSRDYNANVLACVGNLLSQPVYAASETGRTARLFPICSSINNLSKSVRRALCAGLTEIDIANTHFALNAVIWRCPAIRDYIATTSDLWVDLVTTVVGRVADPFLFEAVKGEIKTACYSLFYGAKVRCVARALSSNLAVYGFKKAGRAFFRHPIISAIVATREAAYLTVAKDGGATDCFGRFITISPDTSPASVLSQLAQSLELHCMSAVIDVAEQSDDFGVVLWQHDGATIRCSRRRAKNCERICEAIEVKAAAKGIQLRTTVKYLP